MNECQIMLTSGNQVQIGIGNLQRQVLPHCNGTNRVCVPSQQ